MKKLRRYGTLKLLSLVCVAAVVAWIAFAPTPPVVPVEPVRVKVEQQTSQLEETDMPLSPLPRGDEKSETPETPEAVLSAPVVSKSDEEKSALEKNVTKSKAPEIAIVIDDVGLDVKGSKRAVELPAFITLSFMPYALRLKEQTKEARDNGHELMLHMPMEPVGHEDPGPGALLVGLPADELRQRFETALASFVGFDGVNNHMGSKFTSDPAGMELVMDELSPRHLFFLDSRTSPKSVGASTARQHGVPTLVRDVFLDDDMSLKAINIQLEQTERVAQRKGYAIAIGHPHAVTLDALEQWIPEVQKRGFTLIPVHDVLSQQAAERH